MPSGVYARDTMSRDYRGFKRARMVKRGDGFGTDAVVLVNCDSCPAEIERTNSAVKLAQREGNVR